MSNQEIIFQELQEVKGLLFGIFELYKGQRSFDPLEELPEHKAAKLLHVGVEKLRKWTEVENLIEGIPQYGSYKNGYVYRYTRQAIAECQFKRMGYRPEISNTTFLEENLQSSKLIDPNLVDLIAEKDQERLFRLIG